MNRSPYRLRRTDLRSLAVLQSLPLIITEHEPAGWRKVDELALHRFTNLAQQHRAFKETLHGWLKRGKQIGLAIIGIGPERVFVGVFEPQPVRVRRR
jgi:hypothetical protein